MEFLKKLVSALQFRIEIYLGIWSVCEQVMGINLDGFDLDSFGLDFWYLEFLHLHSFWVI